MGACPKCGKETDPAARVCPACGVIMAKVAARAAANATLAPSRPGAAASLPRQPGPPPPRSASAPPTLPAGAYIPDEAEHAQPRNALVRVGVAAAAALVAMFVLTRNSDPTPPAQAPAFSATRLPRAEPSAEAAGNFSPEDVAFLNALTARLQQSPVLTATPAELERVEKIAGANPTSANLKTLLIDLYLRSADQDLAAGTFPAVELALGKMKIVDDQRPEIHAFEAEARARQSDWAGTVLAAQRYDEVQGVPNVTVSVTLAIALEKSGRREEAVAVLDRPVFQSCLDGAAAAEAQACRIAADMRQALGVPMMAQGSGPAPAGEPETRPRAALTVDANKEQLQSERFDIRFDGESQTGVARDVRFVLDRAYVRLADIYYERPTRKIPVVLHSQQDYFTATGAPWWSGGVYSSHNGAIQIPIRGLPSTLPREMEDVLVHELSHAFVDEMSGGRAGRSLQEGLAQYMEGKRIEQEMSPAELKRLATSGQKSVMSFYMLSLVVSQQLVQSRGQGKINDLLKAMKETGSEDGGYLKVFGQPAATIERDILETFWRRYS